MYQLFETIAVIDFIPQRLEYHQARMDRSYFDFYKKRNPFILKTIFEKNIIAAQGIMKWKIEYNKQDIHSTLTEYIPRRINTAKFIKIKADFDYSYKFVNRSYFDLLKIEHPEFDELIFVKNGYLTDATFANIVLEHIQTGELHTPIIPLLNGTQRQSLIDDKKVILKSINLENIFEYKRIQFINAMLDLNSSSFVLVNKESITF